MRNRLLSFLLGAGLLLAACGPAAAPAAQVAQAPAAADSNLTSIKRYLLDKIAAVQANTTKLKQSSDGYYELARQANFDYAALWQAQPAAVSKALLEAKAAWLAASPLYEQMEGIVAGTPSLSDYDVILDAGSAASADPENAVPFDLTLPDGRILPKPGNLFGVTESALYGTEPTYVIAEVHPDLDGNGMIDFGEALPDANVLKGGVDAMDRYMGELGQKAQAWQPTESEAFGALLANVPTVSAFFDTWKSSRFVVTDPAQASRDFAAISRLSDIVDNVTSWQTIYQGLSPLVAPVDPTADQQIQQGLADLKNYVADIYAKEKGGKRYTPEEADLLSAEAQNRATAIAGQVAQAAAQLNIPVE